MGCMARNHGNPMKRFSYSHPFTTHHQHTTSPHPCPHHSLPFSLSQCLTAYEAKLHSVMVCNKPLRPCKLGQIGKWLDGTSAMWVKSAWTGSTKQRKGPVMIIELQLSSLICLHSRDVRTFNFCPVICEVMQF